jgi:hypothetical protein
MGMSEYKEGLHTLVRRTHEIVSLHWGTAVSYFVGAYVALFLALAATVWIPAAHHDNVRYFNFKFDEVTKPGCDTQYVWLHLIGRPITAKLECQVFKHARSLHDLNNMRIVVIGILAMGATAFGALLYRFGFDLRSSWLTAIAVFLLPGAQNAAFMTNFPNVLAVLASMLAYWCLDGSQNKSFYWMAILGAIGILFVVMLMYPALAFVFLWGTLAKVLSKYSATMRQIVSVVLRDGVVLFLACLAYILVRDPLIPKEYRIHLGLVPDSFKPDISVLAVVGKLPFVFDKVMPTAADLWFINNGMVGKIVVSLFLISLLISMVLEGGKDWLSRYNLLFKSTAVVGLILVSSVPLISNKQPLVHQRLLWPAMGAILITLLSVMPVACAALVRSRGDMVVALRQRICAVVGIGALVAASYATTLNVWNTNIEMEFVRGELAKSDTTPRRIHFVRAVDNGIGFNALNSFSDEFNRRTTDYKHDVRDFVTLAYMGYGGDYGTSIIECDFSTTQCEDTVPIKSIILSVSEYGEKFCLSEKMVVVDLNVLVRATRTGNPKPIPVDLPQCQRKT